MLGVALCAVFWRPALNGGISTSPSKRSVVLSDWRSFLMQSHFSSRQRRRTHHHFNRTDASVAREFEALEVRQLLAADMVLQWNDVLLDAIRTDKTAPPIAARAMAIVQTAVFDAVNSIERQYAPYLTLIDVHPRASQEAAVASAAYECLVALFPAQASRFTSLRTASLQLIADGRSETDGINVGKSAAAAILADRLEDGIDTVVTYTPGTAPGDWQPTPPALASPLLPQWRDVEPWTMSDTNEYRPKAPPALTSKQYAQDFNEVKRLGSANSSARTADQTAIAAFWANGPGTSTPPGHWNIIAQTVAESRQNSLAQNARLFALLNLALADAAIVCWDAKYEYDMWRPVTAIRQASADGNPSTVADAAWSPYLVTPPFPTYTSGHSTFSGAGAGVLTAFFGTDRIRFVVPSETSGISARTFQSFTHAANESGMSRIYGGIHFGFDNEVGLQSGLRLGRTVAQKFLKQVPGSATARLVQNELFVNGTTRADVIRIASIGSQIRVTVNGRSLARFDANHLSLIVVNGGAGNDHITLSGVNVDSELYGGAGNDILRGGNGNDRLFGDSGRDNLFGGPGNDRMDGGAGTDILRGNKGDDQLLGLRGIDRLFGGLGTDELWLS